VNIPNILTLSRLVLAVVMMTFLSVNFPFASSMALLVFVVAGITDYLDGYLARTVYGVTSFGRLMDPLTDKVLVCAAFVSFVELGITPAWIVVIIISREFLVTGLRLLAASQGIVLAAGKWGKHKTIWQIIAIATLLLGLAIRNDLFRNASANLLESYNYCFGYIALAISASVALITMSSGILYFMEHRKVISGR
jgi:CDP-diacylglycerol---glycerol-3-phosphate 3-phosphatidyltransferase